MTQHQGDNTEIDACDQLLREMELQWEKENPGIPCPKTYEEQTEYLALRWTQHKTPIAAQEFCEMFLTTLELAMVGERDEIGIKKIVGTTCAFLEACQCIRLEINSVQSDMLFDFITADDNLTTILANEDSHQHMAWFCMDHSVSHLYIVDAIRAEKLRSALTTLTGKQFPENLTPQLDNVAVFLYGEVCWDLYGIELNSQVPYEDLLKISYEIASVSPVLKTAIIKDATPIETVVAPDNIS